jgi:hypothetical protein
VAYQDLIAACGPAPVSVGVGIVYKDELSPWKDKNFNPIERAKKRAETNARHHRFPTNAPVYDTDSGEIIAKGDMIEGSFSDTPQSSGKTGELPAKRTEGELMGSLGYPEPPTLKKPEPTPAPVQEAKFVDATPEQLSRIADQIEGVLEEDLVNPSLLEEAEAIAASAPPSDEAEKIAAQIRDAMELYRGRPKLKDAEHNMIAPLIESCFESGDKASKRHAVQLALTGKSSLKEIDAPTATGLYHWLRPFQDQASKTWKVNDQARGRIVQLSVELDKVGQPALL